MVAVEIAKPYCVICPRSWPGPRPSRNCKDMRRKGSRVPHSSALRLSAHHPGRESQTETASDYGMSTRPLSRAPQSIVPLW